MGVPQERNYVPHISAVKVFLKPEFYFGTFFCVWNTPKGYQFKDTRISDSFGSPLKRKSSHKSCIDCSPENERLEPEHHPL